MVKLNTPGVNVKDCQCEGEAPICGGLHGYTLEN